ncbi:Embryogenesis-associated protein emb8 [Thalictrum thalictroides]|uniref:Embryogenesis-associated protein emb8 n=1 Tax=Thalictrum thalictroides TaxID=46969 RepID=A0A7J6UXJ4_THATH|nr:Embryogenesis-associated protein emb8 [Thalictrum thalictroides]
MISTSNYLNFHLQSPCFISRTHSFIHIEENRVWRRRRLKKTTTVCSQLGPLINSTSFENLFHSLISQFPYVNSLEVIAPTLGFASGVAIYLSKLNSNRKVEVSNDFDEGEWILFASPTTFNRFVFMRCPSMMFIEGKEVFEDLSDKLVKEDRHYVKLISGKIQVNEKNNNFEENLVYQRICVSTSDGGVISLDFPAKLDLKEEHGMDTTVLIVPGTPEGSMENNIRSFVCECLNRGCFPVVMNPRGCAGSPLTTPRLFTAADSDDICTAIQFINKARPWNTLMAVGWGHGANILTKYLSEVAERTPLTAATCIDNPFDLEEATRSYPYHLAVDQKLTSGLINILQSNKELFRGRANSFNVEKALSATSLRDFEREISMVSYGCESIEEFYSKSSTRELVGNVKIPLLFIQTDDGTVPPFSIPRSSVGANPFTSLLLCSSLPSTALTSEKSVLPWCQHFAIEWLTAVELGLLKGRHPLLKDVDVTINPSAGLALAESSTSKRKTDVNNFLSVTKMDGLKEYPVDSIEDVKKNNVLVPSQGTLSEAAESQVKIHEIREYSGSDDTESVNETEENSADNERSQVLQSAQALMNMLDTSMPGTLEEEQKKKVLDAMERGETLLKALEGAVPEDVRGKLTSAVSEIAKTQGTSLNLRSLVPNASSKVKSKLQETFKQHPSAAVGITSPGDMELGDDMSGETNKKESAVEKLETESDIQPSQALEKSLDQIQDASGITESKETNVSEQNQDQDESSGPKEHSPGYGESVSGADSRSRTKEADDSDTSVGEQEKVIQGDDMSQMSSKEANANQIKEGTNIDILDDQNKSSSTTATKESLLPVTSSPEPQGVEEEPSNVKKDGESMEGENEQGPPRSEEPAPSPVPTPNPSSFNVSEALDALTGFDDSTQVAVNSVFGVLENMISKLEEENGQESDGKQDKSKDGESNPSSEESQIASETEDISKNKENSKSELSLESPQVQNKHLVHGHPDESAGHQGVCIEKQLTQSDGSSLEKNSGSSSGSSFSNHVDKGTDTRMKGVNDSTLSMETPDNVGHICKVPVCVTVNPYGDSLYNEHLRRYLLSQMPNAESLDLDSTADLLLDYFPEEGQWKLLDQTENGKDPDIDIGIHKTINGRIQVKRSPPRDSEANQIIETSYVILNTGKEQQPIEEYKTEDGLTMDLDNEESRSELVGTVKSIILDCLKVEVGRRLGFSDMNEMEPNLALELEHVAEEVSQGAGHTKVLTKCLENESALGEVGPLFGEDILQTISLAVNDSIYLKKVLPVGVVVGSCLAALNNYFSVAREHDNGYNRATFLDHANDLGKEFKDQVSETGNDQKLVSSKHQYTDIDSSVKAIDKSEGGNNDAVMVGAVTAAIGASALMAHQQRDAYNCDESVDVSSRSLTENGYHSEAQENVLDVTAEKDQNSIVSSLAEKAMSVAGPVVPTKSDGGLDQERLVAMLSDLGQKGGMLRLIGKLALLWGGIRGAMSLTDKLISFLHIADRPLYQRLCGFVCMVLVLWSPVVIPLFPTLVQGWALHNSSGIAEYACIIGLYTAVTMLIYLWGKRIRGYKDPLEQYGLDMTSKAKFLDFLKGLLGGVMLVISIHSINSLLGFAHFSLSSDLLLSSPHSLALLKACGRLLKLAGQGIVTATVVVVVEEILFRSWLPQEIAVDFGDHCAAIISGFVFSVFQRSLRSIPGLWFLSIALSGLKQRSKGSLSIPIGIRAGILSSSFMLQTGGFLTYHSGSPLWLAGAHPLQPFDGVVGLAFCIMLAILLYPKQPLEINKIERAIGE